MKTLFSIICICTFAVLGGLGCDGDDCPTCPQQPPTRYDGRAYVTLNTGRVAVFVIDIESDSVVDSLMFPNAVGVNVKVTADGRYLLTSITDGIFRVHDTRDLSLVSSTATFGGFELVHHDSMVLGSRPDTLTLYTFPDFDTVMHATIPHRDARDCYSPYQRLLYRFRGADTLLAISEDSLKVVREWVIKEGGSSAYYLNSVAVHPDGKTAYFIAYGPGSAVFLAYDLTNDRLLHIFPLKGPYGYVRVSPDGREVWVTDPWFTYGTFVSSAILVFDAANGGFRYSISLVGYLPEHPLVPLIARALEFTPDGTGVIVTTGDGREQGGTVLRISTLTNKIEKIYFPDFRLYPYEIAIGRKP